MTILLISMGTTPLEGNSSRPEKVANLLHSNGVSVGTMSVAKLLVFIGMTPLEERPAGRIATTNLVTPIRRAPWGERSAKDAIGRLYWND